MCICFSVRHDPPLRSASLCCRPHAFDHLTNGFLWFRSTRVIYARNIIIARDRHAIRAMSPEYIYIYISVYMGWTSRVLCCTPTYPIDLLVVTHELIRQTKWQRQQRCGGAGTRTRTLARTQPDSAKLCRLLLSSSVADVPCCCRRTDAARRCAKINQCGSRSMRNRQGI